MSHVRITNEAMIRQYKKRSINLPNGTTLKRVDQKVVDIFFNEGWKEYSRYRQVKGRWLFISGKELPDNEVQQLLGKL